MSVYVELGDGRRELRYPWKSVKRLKSECQLNLLSWKGDVSDPDTITAVLWAGLIWETPDLTRDQVDDWITLKNLVAIEERVADALQEALGIEARPNA